MSWWRRRREPDRIVGEVAVTEPYFMAHPKLGVIDVLGEGTEAPFVFRTTTEPFRWFVVIRAVGGRGWVSCQILAEVEPTKGVEATMSHAVRGHEEKHRRELVTRMLDVEITQDEDYARRYAGLPPRKGDHATGPRDVGGTR